MTVPSPADTKAAAQAALSIATAATAGYDCTDLINELEEPQIVIAALAGMFAGMLNGLDENISDAGRLFLVSLGRRIEALPEGGA